MRAVYGSRRQHKLFYAQEKGKKGRKREIKGHEKAVIVTTLERLISTDKSKRWKAVLDPVLVPSS